MKTSRTESGLTLLDMLLCLCAAGFVISVIMMFSGSGQTSAEIRDNALANAQTFAAGLDESATVLDCSGQDSYPSDGYVSCSVKDGEQIVELDCAYEIGAVGCKIKATEPDTVIYD